MPGHYTTALIGATRPLTNTPDAQAASDGPPIGISATDDISVPLHCDEILSPLPHIPSPTNHACVANDAFSRHAQGLFRTTLSHATRDNLLTNIADSPHVARHNQCQTPKAAPTACFVEYISANISGTTPHARTRRHRLSLTQYHASYAVHIGKR